MNEVGLQNEALVERRRLRETESISEPASEVARLRAELRDYLRRDRTLREIAATMTDYDNEVHDV